MNRWVLLEHKVLIFNSIDIHYDFLIEDKKDCLTWKFLEIPSFTKGFVKIGRQSNHRLVWLSRKEYELSRNRGLVKRIDHGNFINLYPKLDCKKLKLILDGCLLNGLLEISEDICRLTKND